MRYLAPILIAALTAGSANAQTYNGTFTAINPQGNVVTLVLAQDAGGAVTGTISTTDITLAVSGRVEDGAVIGEATADGVRFLFEAELDDGQLYFVLMEPDAQGNPDYETGQEMVFQAGGMAAARGAVSGQGNPLAAGGNPLAGGVAGDPVSGTYSNGAVTVMLQAGQSGQYQGQIAMGGEQWPVALQLQQNGILSGSFSTTAGQFPVAMQVSGSTMVMESGGTTYQLQRQGGAAVGSQSANPLAAGGQSQSAGQGAMRGSGAGAGGGQLGDGTPLANEWVNHLRGKKITYMDSYSSGSSGGYSQRTDVFLCSSGEFLIKEASSVSVDVGDAFGNTGGNSSNTGRWRILTQGQLVGIELKFNDGRSDQYQLTYQDGKTYANGDRVYVTPAEICQ